MTSITDNIKAVLERVARAAEAAGRDPARIKLLAVSKAAGAEAILEAIRAGQRAFGESRIQEAERKMRALSGEEIEWHFIGHLQTNKAGQAARMGFALIHSLDSVKLLHALDRHAREAGRVQRALIEVKLSPEGTKHGVDEAGLTELLGESGDAPNIKIEGLMTIPPWSADPEASRPYFRRLRELRDRAERSGFRLPELSMGMTGDFEEAIKEGSTIVRVGTAIFGERPYPKKGEGA